ncbi:MAG: DUF6644 family protein [Bryobacteraceae bacterium]
MIRQSLLPFFEWYAGTPLGRVMSTSSTLIVTAQIVHLIGLTLLVGTIMMVDLTLLGLGIKRHSAAEVAGELAPWTLAGLAIMLLTGPLNLASEAMRCYDSSFFWIKMGLLAVALLFHFTVHRRVTSAEPPVSRFRAGIVGSVSLALWFGIALAAKFIGFYGEDLRQARLFY